MKADDLTKNGKPKRSEKRQRTFMVQVRLTKEENKHLAHLAKLANVSRPTVVRYLVTGKELKAARIYPDPVYRAIIGLGRNLNQLVMKFHSTGHLPDKKVKELLEEVRELRSCLTSK